MQTSHTDAHKNKVFCKVIFYVCNHVMCLCLFSPRNVFLLLCVSPVYNMTFVHIYSTTWWWSALITVHVFIAYGKSVKYENIKYVLFLFLMCYKYNQERPEERPALNLHIRLITPFWSFSHCRKMISCAVVKSLCIHLDTEQRVFCRHESKFLNIYIFFFLCDFNHCLVT